MNQSWLARLFANLREYRWTYLTIVAAILTIIALFIPKIFHPFRCEVTNAPASFTSSDGYSIDGQVILRGTRTDIQNIVAGPLQLSLIEGCDLSYLNYRDNPNPSLTEAQRKDLVVQLYQIPAGSTFDDVIRKINDAAELQPNLYIVADHNYFVRRSDAQNDPCGQPESSGGTGGGKDFGGPGELGSASTASDVFKNQWAFGGQGINLPSPATLSAFTGRGVRVAVFDSSPFRINLPFYRRIGMAFPGPVWFKVRDTSASRNLLSSHGMYVAELIHSVAPKSRIDLIHVLDDNGCTRMMPLIEALNRYIARRSFWTGGMNKHILNLSLGVAVPASTTGSGTDPDLETLRDTLDSAYNIGAIIVASAGNDSPGVDETGTTVDPMPMLAPAEFKNVIGVAATAKDGKRSCYSNFGDIAAPGGNGEVTTDPNHPCVPRTETSTSGTDPCDSRDMKNCKYGVISLVLTDTGPQYALWSGTSFATPLVSGLAALVYEKWDQRYVECIIMAGARKPPAITPPNALGAGIIDFQNTLSTTAIPSTCPSYP